MFLRRQKFEKHSIVYKLGYASVDEVSEKIEDFLTSLKAEKDNILRIRLSVEEALLRWIDHCEPGTEFRLETGMQWNRPFIILKLWGPEYNPLAESKDESGVWVGELLGAIGLVPVYRYINSCNVIQLLLHRPHTNPGITLMAFAMA